MKFNSDATLLWIEFIPIHFTPEKNHANYVESVIEEDPVKWFTQQAQGFEIEVSEILQQHGKIPWEVNEQIIPRIFFYCEHGK